jgi:hypothetical protein
MPSDCGRSSSGAVFISGHLGASVPRSYCRLVEQAPFRSFRPFGNYTRIANQRFAKSVIVNEKCAVKNINKTLSLGDTYAMALTDITGQQICGPIKIRIIIDQGEYVYRLAGG